MVLGSDSITLRVRRFADPSPRCDVWLIHTDGPAESGWMWGQVPNDLAMALADWFASKGIVVDMQHSPYVSFPIDPNVQESRMRRMYENGAKPNQDQPPDRQGRAETSDAAHR